VEVLGVVAIVVVVVEMEVDAGVIVVLEVFTVVDEEQDARTNDTTMRPVNATQIIPLFI
jgi:hypothetical protein